MHLPRIVERKSARRDALGADELHFATTDDGWRLALHRYRASVRPARRHPVVLCHGMGANHLGFDLAPEVSLSRRLAALGFDVFALDLRGHGASEPATFRGPHRWGFSFDDYLHLDVPAALATVLATSGASAAHWIGHSMGGILLFAHLAAGGGAKLVSGTAIGSTLDYSSSESGFKKSLWLRPFGKYVPAVPIGSAMALGAPFTGWFGSALERFNVWPGNVDPVLVRRLHAKVFGTVSTAVLVQLGTAFTAGGLRSADGSRCYLDDLRAADVRTPVLALAGDRDEQCPLGASECTLAALRSRTQLAEFGVAQGHSSHYGHFDLIIGKRAPIEVWPAIEDWLVEHDAASPQGSA